MGQDQLVTHRIVVYTKPGCHLCEDALAMLHQLREAFRLTIEEINIEGDGVLLEKYFDQIPVLVIDDFTTLAAPIHADDVRAALIS